MVTAAEITPDAAMEKFSTGALPGATIRSTIPPAEKNSLSPRVSTKGPAKAKAVDQEKFLVSDDKDLTKAEVEVGIGSAKPALEMPTFLKSHQ